MERTIPPFFLFVSLALCLTLSHAIDLSSPTSTARRAHPKGTKVSLQSPVARDDKPNNNESTLAPTSQTVPTPITVDEACTKVTDKSYCIKTLSSRPEIKNQLSMKDVAFLALTIAGENVDDSYRYLSDMPVNEDDAAPEMDDAVQDCMGQYEDAAAQVEDSMNAFIAGAYNDVQTWMSVAIKNGETCSNTIKDAKVKDFMGPRNADLAKICGLAIDLSKVALSQ